MSRRTLGEDFDDDVVPWELPYVEEEQVADESKTNALNRTSQWKYEPPEEEEEIQPPTAEEIEAIRAAAYEDGFAQGKQEGLEKGHEEGMAKGFEEGFADGQSQGQEQGRAEGKEQIDEHMQVLSSLLERLHKPVAQVDKQLEQELVRLSVALARSVIRSEVRTNEDIIFQALSEGLKVLPIQENAYQIHLNPEDIQLIRAHFSEQEIERHHWVFVESPDMARGGCDITTQSNAVDVSIERRARDVLDKFLLDQGLKQVDD